MPGGSDLFADGIVVVPHLVKGKGIELSGINLSLLVQNLLIGQDIHDFPKDAEAAQRLIDTVLAADAEMASDPRLERVPEIVPRILSLMDDVFAPFPSWDAREVRLDQASRMMNGAEDLARLLSEAVDAGWLPGSCVSRTVAEDISRFCSKILSMRPDMDRVERFVERINRYAVTGELI